MKCRIVIICLNSGKEFFGLESESGAIFDLEQLSKGIVSVHSAVSEDEKHDVIVEDITDLSY